MGSTAMTQYQHVTPAATTPLWLNSLGARIMVWATTCADCYAAARDYYAAAAMYEQLSTLCDAELARRGFSRATLARDVCELCDRSRHARAPSDPVRCACPTNTRQTARESHM